MENYEKKYKDLLELLSYHKKEICHKVSEKEFHQNQISLIDTHIIEVKNKSNSLCNDFISEYSNTLLNKHPHFQKFLVFF